MREVPLDVGNCKSSLFAAVALVAIALGGAAAAHPLITVYGFGSGGPKNGGAPGGIVFDRSGNLFGLAAGGYLHHGCYGGGCGVAYELRNGRTFKLVYRFCSEANCSDGEQPFGPLIVDTSGNLYGTTLEGGSHNSGTAFELSPVGNRWVYRKLYDFCSQGATCTDGATPSSGLTYAGATAGEPYDGVSPLYGVTLRGSSGLSGVGGIAYQLTPAEGQWSETVLYTFCSLGGTQCTDGTKPLGALLVDAHGNLLGTTLQGGNNHPAGFDQGGGVAFQLSPVGSSWVENVLHNFCSEADCSDGASPDGSLISDSSGNLYGDTSEGGSSCVLAQTGETSCGTIFKLSYDGSSWQESVLHQFCQKSDCPDGAVPPGGLVMNTAGDLFGTTSFGGGNDIDSDHQGGGVVFKLSGTTLKVLHSFCALANCADGGSPETGMAQSANGYLLGTTGFGGAYGGGTVFKIKP